MIQVSNIKLVALAVIYVLHVTFFDALMGNGAANSVALSALSHQKSSQNNFPPESSYRMLTKHEKAKDSQISLPDFLDFVSPAFALSITEHFKQPQFGAFAHLNVNTFKLYRLFRVFLI